MGVSRHYPARRPATSRQPAGGHRHPGRGRQGKNRLGHSSRSKLRELTDRNTSRACGHHLFRAHEVYVTGGQVKMVTGDRADVACETARLVGLGHKILPKAQLDTPSAVRWVFT